MDRSHSVDELAEAQGASVYSSEGEKIGTIEDIYYDWETGEPEWIGIGTGFFGTKYVVVPVRGSALSEEGLTVPYSRDRVKDTPDLDVDDISQETERSLAEHYGLGYSTRASSTGLPEDSGAPSEPRLRRWDATGSAVGADPVTDPSVMDELDGNDGDVERAPRP